MKTAHVWLRPTKSSPACRYSYDPQYPLTVGRKMLSDCAVWMTFYAKDILVHPDGTDVCPFCCVGHCVAPLKVLPTPKQRSKQQLIHLRHDA